MNAAGFNAQNTLAADGAVWRLKLSNGATTKLVSGLVQQLSHVAVGGGRLYFDEPEAKELYSVPLPNGAVNPVKLADCHCGELVADDKAVYWTDVADGRILTCPHTGCTTPEVIAPGQTAPNSLTQDAVSLYWGSGNPGPGVGPLQRLAK